MPSPHVLRCFWLNLALVLAACAPAATAPSVPTEMGDTAADVQRKVLHLDLGFGDVPTLDPAIAQDTTSLQIIDEAFIGLTYVDPVTYDTKPGMASTWDTVNNADGSQTITFHLRDDVPWVRWNGSEVESVKTCEGSTRRFVTAHDFAYGIERNLDPATASPYAYVWGFVLTGADDYNMGVTDDFATVGVKVIDDFTLELRFLSPAAYNVQIAGMWIGRPQPRWVIEGDCDGALEARGERWTEPGFFQSFGPYTMSEWIHDSQLVIVKNPFWPGTGAVGAARIDEIRFSMLHASAAFAEFEAGHLDVTGVPGPEMDRVKADSVLSRGLQVAPLLCSGYYGFNTTAEHVSDARVRRALSMAVDRRGLIENVTKSGAEPAQWFGRPGLEAAPTIETHPDLGIQHDPDAARAQLQSYLDDTGLTADALNLTLVYAVNEASDRIAQAIQQMWASELGLNVQLASQEWTVYLDTVNSLRAPQVWGLGWCADYPDENNFLRDVFASGAAANPTDAQGNPAGGVMWKNAAFEDLVGRAALESNAELRVALYAQAEEILVDTDAVIIPLTWGARTTLTQPHVRPVFGSGGVDPLHEWDILPH